MADDEQKYIEDLAIGYFDDLLAAHAEEDAPFAAFCRMQLYRLGWDVYPRASEDRAGSRGYRGPMVDAHVAAELLDLSRERFGDLARRWSFPHPSGGTVRRPLWDIRALVEWIEGGRKGA